MIISHQKGRGKKIHLLIDGEYAITTDIDFWADNYIKSNTEISDDEWDKLVEKINYKKAVNKCVDLLSRRDHSVKELRDKLLKTVDPASADRAIEHMTELGYLDDTKFANTLTAYLFGTKKYSKNHVIQECRKRGISYDIIDTVVMEYDFDNVSSAKDIILSKYMTKLEDSGGYDKVVAALMRKGFTYSDIKTAINQVINSEEDYIR